MVLTRQCKDQDLTQSRAVAPLRADLMLLVNNLLTSSSLKINGK